MKITMIIGGANSGKTAFALDLLNSNSEKYYLATAESLDNEMREKISNHKLEREGMNIHTIEESHNLKKVWPQISPNGVVLMDCLTMWGTNLMFKEKELLSKQDFKSLLEEHFNQELMNFKELIIITNEIGMGGISMDRDVRRMNLLLGMANQYIGKLCNEAWTVICGIPKRWK